MAGEPVAVFLPMPDELLQRVRSIAQGEGVTVAAFMLMAIASAVEFEDWARA